MRILSCLSKQCCRNTQTPSKSPWACSAPVLRVRAYATSREQTSSSLLSQALDRKHRTSQRDDYVGPFQLGLTQPSISSGEKLKKWSELSASGKVLRTTARTTNLTVILLGAGLSAVLIYALTSELFSKNSPTVLYGEACERIKSSPRVSKYLHAPLSFHNNPPSSVRPRHHNHHVASQISVDSTGREHMILSFYVHGSKAGSALVLNSDQSYFQSTVDWTKDKASIFSELTYDELLSWAKERANLAWDKSKGAFKYLSGSPSSTPPLRPAAPAEDEGKKKVENAWSLGGIFSGFKGLKGTADLPEAPSGTEWTDGEVHAELVRNDDGYFVFRYLFVDIPDSRDRNHVRIFIERAPGVRDNEPVVRWGST